MQFPIIEGVSFAAIPGFQNYCAGDDGSVWSKARFGPKRNCEMAVAADDGTVWRKLRTHKLSNGYWIVVMSAGKGAGQTKKLASVILTAFRGVRPDGMEARHLDGNRSNNALSNLAWGTRAENVEDRYRHGTQPMGESSGKGVLTNAIVLAARELDRQGVKVPEIARRFGVHKGTLWFAVRRKTWKHI